MSSFGFKVTLSKRSKKYVMKKSLQDWRALSGLVEGWERHNVHKDRRSGKKRLHNFVDLELTHILRCRSSTFSLVGKLLKFLDDDSDDKALTFIDPIMYVEAVIVASYLTLTDTALDSLFDQVSAAVLKYVRLLQVQEINKFAKSLYTCLNESDCILDVGDRCYKILGYCEPLVFGVDFKQFMSGKNVDAHRIVVNPTSKQIDFLSDNTLLFAVACIENGWDIENVVSWTFLNGDSTEKRIYALVVVKLCTWEADGVNTWLKTRSKTVHNLFELCVPQPRLMKSMLICDKIGCSKTCSKFILCPLEDTNSLWIDVFFCHPLPSRRGYKLNLGTGEIVQATVAEVGHVYEAEISKAIELKEKIDANLQTGIDSIEELGKVVSCRFRNEAVVQLNGERRKMTDELLQICDGRIARFQIFMQYDEYFDGYRCRYDETLSDVTNCRSVRRRRERSQDECITDLYSQALDKKHYRVVTFCGIEPYISVEKR